MSHQSVHDSELELQRSIADEARKLKLLEAQAETLARVRYLVEHACDRPRPRYSPSSLITSSATHSVPTTDN
jgi:hypothetical protein